MFRSRGVVYIAGAFGMSPEVLDVATAVKVVQRGGVLLYPTSTLWGLGGDARRRDVLQRIQGIKRREGSPFLVLIPERAAVGRLVDPLPSLATQLMDAFWPGPLTLLLPAASTVLPELVGSEGFVGLRLPTHPLTRELVEKMGSWLVSTSANFSGDSSPRSLAEVHPQVRSQVDGVLAGGCEPEGLPSTIVAVPTTGAARLVREGAIPREELARLLGDGLIE